MLNYGDAVAHLHIARRVFDSHQSRPQQLGSVWLPLPHLLLIPFVAVYSWWANGIAGMIPSALAYLAGCAGIYRLARHWLQPAAAALALAFFATNPNLLYLQTTAMTEPLFLCEMIWTVVWLVEWRASMETINPGPTRRLWLIAAVLVAAIFTRYDGWILALLAWSSIGVALLRRGEPALAHFLAGQRAGRRRHPLHGSSTTQPSLATGSTSPADLTPPRAIEIRTATSRAGPPHPGWHNPWVSLLFFIKTAEMDAAAARVGKRAARSQFLGTAGAWLIARRRAFQWALLLWLPGPLLCVLHRLWLGAHLSSRLVAPLLVQHALRPRTAARLRAWPRLSPPISVSAPCASSSRPGQNTRRLSFCARRLERLASQCASTRSPMLKARRTSIPAVPFEKQIPPVLRALLATRPGGVVLMDTSVYPQLVALTGIPLRQTINESDKAVLLRRAGRARHPCRHRARLRRRRNRSAPSKRILPDSSPCNASMPPASPPPRFTSPIPRTLNNDARSVIASGKESQ